MIDQQTFAARHADGAFVVDCREPQEYLAGHIPGAVFVPMSQVTLHLDAIPKGQDVYVVCASGNRSTSVTELLNRMGYSATSVEGGTNAWAADARPLVAGPRAA